MRNNKNNQINKTVETILDGSSNLLVEAKQIIKETIRVIKVSKEKVNQSLDKKKNSLNP